MQADSPWKPINIDDHAAGEAEAVCGSGNVPLPSPNKMGVPKLSVADGKSRERPIPGVNRRKSALTRVVSALRGDRFGFRREDGLAAGAAVFRESEDASAVRHNRENSEALCQGAGKRVKDPASSQHY